MTELLHPGFDQARGQPADQPYLDTTAYGSGPDNSITDVTEAAAITHHVVTVGGQFDRLHGDGGASRRGRSGQLEAVGEILLRRLHQGRRRGRNPPGDLLLQRRPGLVGGVPAARLVRPAPHQDQHAGLHAAPALRDGGQSRQPHRPQRPRLHQSGRHGVLVGDRAVQEPRLLGRRPGRALDQAVHQALPDGERPLELAQVPVRRILRHRAHLRARLDAARGRHRPQRPHASVERARLSGEFHQRRRAHADLRRGRLVSQQDRSQPAAAEPAGLHGHGDRVLLGRYAKALAAYPNQDPATVQTLSQYLGVPANMLDRLAAQRRGRGPARPFPVPDHASAGPGARARRLRRPCDGHRHRDRGDRVARRRHERPDDGGGRRRLHRDVEHLSQHRASVHLDIELHRPQRPGVPVLGFQPHRPGRARSRNPIPRAIRRSTRRATSRRRWRPIPTSSSCRRTAISTPSRPSTRPS